MAPCFLIFWRLDCVSIGSYEFFMEIKRKISIALNILHKQGLFLGGKYILSYFLEDIWLLGKVIELRGNVTHLDGCTFYLDSSFIDTKLKSRFLLKSWEMETRYLIKKYLPNHLPIIEFGACMGVVSCITNKLLTDPDSHIVVEANRNLIPIIKMHREKNDCRFKIMNAAIAYGTKKTSFYMDQRINEGSTIRRTSEPITVPAISLKAILQQGEFSKASLICDIEGSEIDLFANEGSVISDHIERVVLEIHSRDTPDEAQSNLELLGFTLIEQFNRDCIYHNDRFNVFAQSGYRSGFFANT